MPATSPFQFRQIDDAYQAFDRTNPDVFKNVDIFSKFLNSATGTQDYAAGTGGFSNLLKGGSANIDRALDWTRIPEATEALGGAVGKLFGAEQAGADAGHHIPRGILDFLPMLLGGPVGAIGKTGLAIAKGVSAGRKVGTGISALAAGANAYEKSDSPIQAGITGGLTAAIPGLFELGHQAGMGVAKKLGADIATRGEATIAAYAAKGSEIGAEAVEKAGQLVAGKFSHKLAGYAGGQITALGAFELGNEVSGALNGTGLYNPLTKENLVANLVGQLPFAILDVPYLVKKGTPADLIKATVDKDIQAQADEFALENQQVLTPEANPLPLAVKSNLIKGALLERERILTNEELTVEERDKKLLAFDAEVNALYAKLKVTPETIDEVIGLKQQGVVSYDSDAAFGAGRRKEVEKQMGEFLEADTLSIDEIFSAMAAFEAHQIASEVPEGSRISGEGFKAEVEKITGEGVSLEEAGGQAARALVHKGIKSVEAANKPKKQTIHSKLQDSLNEVISSAKRTFPAEHQPIIKKAIDEMYSKISHWEGKAGHGRNPQQELQRPIRNFLETYDTTFTPEENLKKLNAVLNKAQTFLGLDVPAQRALKEDGTFDTDYKVSKVKVYDSEEVARQKAEELNSEDEINTYAPKVRKAGGWSVNRKSTPKKNVSLTAAAQETATIVTNEGGKEVKQAVKELVTQAKESDLSHGEIAAIDAMIERLVAVLPKGAGERLIGSRADLLTPHGYAELEKMVDKYGKDDLKFMGKDLPENKITFDRKGLGSVPVQVDIHYFGFTKSMSPRDYRSLVPAGVSGEKTNAFLKANAEKTIAPPWLKVEWDGVDNVWRVIEHEGRSRADYAQELGVNSLPVDFMPISLRNRDITDAMRQAPIVPQNQKYQVNVGKVEADGYLRDDLQLMAKDPLETINGIVDENNGLLKVGRQSFEKQAVLKEDTIVAALNQSNVPKPIWEYLKIKYPDLVKNGFVSRERFLEAVRKPLVETRVHDGGTEVAGNVAVELGQIQHSLETTNPDIWVAFNDGMPAARIVDTYLPSSSPELKASVLAQISRAEVLRSSASQTPKQDFARKAAETWDISPDKFTPYDKETGLGHIAFEILADGVDSENGHTQNRNTLGWVRGSFVMHVPQFERLRLIMGKSDLFSTKGIEQTATELWKLAKFGIENQKTDNFEAKHHAEMAEIKQILSESERIFRIDEIQSDAVQAHAKLLKDKPKLIEQFSITLKEMSEQPEARLSGEGVGHPTNKPDGWVSNLGETYHTKLEAIKASKANIEHYEESIRNIQSELTDSAHPLFPLWNRIAVGTALREARNHGAKGVMPPDSNTIMMTEGHDAYKDNLVIPKHVTQKDVINKWEELRKKGQLPEGMESYILKWEDSFITDGNINKTLVAYEYAGSKDATSSLGDYYPGTGRMVLSFEPLAKEFARPSQEQGMIRSYDEEIPNLFKKFTDSPGEVIDLGRHKKSPIGAIDEHFLARALEAGWTEAAFREEHNTSGQLRPVVLRKPDGTPHTNITGKLFPVPDLQPLQKSRSLNETNLSSTLPLFENHEDVMTQIFSGMGLRPKEVRSNVAASLAVIKGFETARQTNLGELSGTEALGAQSSSRDAIYLNIKKLIGTKDPLLARVGLTHELVHQEYEAYKRGELSPELTKQLDSVYKAFDEALPEERQLVMKTLIEEAIPKKLRAGLLDVVSGEHLSATAEETRVTLHSIIATAMVMPKNTGRLGELMMHLPKPVGDLIRAIAKYARQMVGALKGLANLGQKGFADPLSPELRQSLTEFSSQIKALSRVEARMDHDQATLLRLEQIEPEGYYAALMRNSSEGSTGDYFSDFSGSPEANDLQFMAKGEMGLDPVPSKLRRFTSAVARFIEPVNLVGARKKAFEKLTSLALDHSATVQASYAEIISALATVLGKDGIRIPTKDMKHLDPIFHSKRIESKVFTKITQHTNKSEQPFNKNDPFVKSELAKLTPSQRETVLNGIEVFSHSMTKVWDVVLKSRHANGATELATLFVTADVNLFPKTEHAEKFAKGMWEAAKGLQDPATMDKSLSDLGEYAQRLEPNLYNKALTFTLEVQKLLDGLNTFLRSRPWYLSERRFRKYQITFRLKGEAQGGRVDGDTPEKAQQALKDQIALRKSEGREVLLDTVKRETQNKGDKKFGVAEGVLDRINQVDIKKQELLKNVLAEYPDGNKIFDELRGHMNTGHEVAKDYLARDMTAKIGRSFAPGREQLNMGQNHTQFIMAIVRSEANKFLRYQTSLHSLDKAVQADPITLQQVKQSIEQYLIPDTKAGSTLTKFNFVYHLGMRFASHLIEMGQSVFSLAPVLSENGAGYMEGYKLIGKAMKRAVTHARSKGKKSVGDVEIDEFLKRASKEELIFNLGAFTEFLDPEFARGINLRNFGKEKEPFSVHDIYKKPIGQFANISATIYGVATHFNARTSLIAAFELSRSKMLKSGDKLLVEKGKLTKEGMDRAFEFARKINYLSNFSAGRAGRPQGLFDSAGGMRTASQALWSLQSYQMGMISTYARMFQRGFFHSKEFTPAQRKDMRRAAIQLFGTQLVAAGALGLPAVGAALALMEQLFPDLEINKLIRENFAKMAGDDEELGGVVADVALRGLPHMIPNGPDLSSRYALGNVMGVSNYDGFSLSTLVGPTGNLFKSLTGGVQELSQGQLGAAAQSALPLAFKNLIRLYREDGTLRNERGSPLIGDLSTGEKLGYALGFNPQRVARMQESNRLQSRSEEIALYKYQKLQKQIVETFESEGPNAARNLVMASSNEDPSILHANLARAVAKRIVDRQTPVDLRRKIGSRTAGSGQQLLQASQNSMPPPQEVQRYAMQKQLEQLLGVPGQGRLSASELSQKGRLDQFLLENPFVPLFEAKRRLGIR